METHPRMPTLVSTSTGRDGRHGGAGKDGGTRAATTLKLPLTALIHPSAWNRNSRKFIAKILYSSAPIRSELPLQIPPHNPTRYRL